jgi:hypothetical protein
MPQVIPVIASVFASLGVGGGAGAAAATAAEAAGADTFAMAAAASAAQMAAATTLATTLVTTTVISAAEFAIGKIAHSSIKDPGTKLSQRNPAANQRVIYGTQRVGGTVTYMATSADNDSSNGNMHLVLTIAGHQIHQFRGAGTSEYVVGQPYRITVPNKDNATAVVPLVIFLDDLAVPLTINGAAAYGGSGTAHSDGAYYVPKDYDPGDKNHDFRDVLQVEIDLGDPTNTSQPFPLLHTAIPAWDGTCLQQGCAKVHIRFAWDQDKFPNGIPHISFAVDGKLVFDPRDESTGFSNNVALCLRDWLTDTKFGMGVDSSRIDDDTVSAAANICDEDMDLREGGTQKRYTCDGTIESGTERGSAAASILAAMGGVLVPPSDSWKMFAGAYRDPVLEITDNDLRAPIKIDTRVSRRDLANAVKGTYVAPVNKWEATDYPPYVNGTYVVEDGGTVTTTDGDNFYTGLIFTDLAFDFVTDPVRAQRLAKIHLEKIRRKAPLVLQAKLKAFEAEAGDTIEFTHARFGFDAATYLVTNTGLVLDNKGNAPVLGYDMVCVAVDSDVYAWDPDIDEGTVEMVDAPFLPDSRNVGAPTDLVLLSDSTTSIIRADGTHPQILVTWTAPTDTHVLKGGFIEIFIKKASDSDYLLEGSALGDATSYYISKNLSDGLDYDVKIRSVNTFGAHSASISDNVICSNSAPAGSGAGPIGVSNNDFEVSDSLSPAPDDWTATGTATLSFDIDTQQQGTRSLKVATSHQYAGVYATQKVPVVPGDTFTGESYKVGGYIKGDGTGHGVISFVFFDASDAEVGRIEADGGSPTPADWFVYSAAGLCPNEAVYGRVYLQNYTTTGTSVLLEFDSIFLIRVASLEDEIVDGPSRGAITAANTSYRPLSNPLTAIDAGSYAEIDIASFTMRIAMNLPGGHDVSVNSGSIISLSYDTTYHVYYDDPEYDGGAVTYYANTDQAIALDATGRFYVGSITTPAAGGADTTGNNDGGTGAQSGQLYWLSPTLKADDSTVPVTWYPASNALEADGDTSTPYIHIVPNTDGNDNNEIDTIWLGGIPTIYSKWTSLKLKVRSEVVSVDDGGAAFLRYSLDDGGTFTDIYSVEAGAQAPGDASAGANSGSGTSWTNPANIADPSSYATITGMAHGSTSKFDKATGMGFSIPSGSTINGITIDFDQITGGSAVTAGEAPTFNVQLLKAGTPVGDIISVTDLSTPTLEVGNSLDLWGTTWSYADINDTNFGFQVQAVTPAAASNWSASTYYSPLSVILKTIAGITYVFSVQTAGTTGSSEPSWNTTLSGTTSDSGVTWVTMQNSVTRANNTTYADGHYIVASTTGGNCLFKLTKQAGTSAAQPKLISGTTAYVWNKSGLTGAPFYLAYGSFCIPYPSPTPNSNISSVQSLHWSSDNPIGSDSNSANWHLKIYPISGNGALTTPIVTTALYENVSVSIVGKLYFPAAGTYNFQLSNDDGAFIGFQSSVTKVSGSIYQPSGLTGITRTARQGYTIMAGDNTDGNNASVPFSLKVSAAGQYGFEICYTNSIHRGHVILTCKDSSGAYQEIIGYNTTDTTDASAPTFPAWSTSYDPSRPSVTEGGGQYKWVNYGPTGDFAWSASTHFTNQAVGATTDASLELIDGNGYGQTPYRAGKSSSGSAPAFSSVTNGLVTDGSTLTWRNDGNRSTVTTFDFSIRDAKMFVDFTPSTATESRALQTDTITLPARQNLGLVQVEYGLLTAGGEMHVHEVWVEAQAGNS